jgi:thiamine biosynthesis lipoprotein
VGAFDPTVGGTLTRQGFDTNFRTGERVVLSEPTGADLDDIMLDSDAGTVTLQRPLLLDLGGVAKGMAIDLAAQELRPCRDFAINAGGDVYLAGQNPGGHPWRVGIRHPRIDDAIIAEVAVSGMAVCTSGDYERRRPGNHEGHHIVEPATGASATSCASVSVVAPTAMFADALGTAAFVLGPHAGIDFLEAQGADGFIVSSDLREYATEGFSKWLV